jgi:hypothetical protein
VKKVPPRFFATNMNICFPDSRKSCAACCGLYNVADGSRHSLEANLRWRTEIFRDVERSPDALEEFKTSIREREAPAPLDDMIHVCEFAGFLDSSNRVVGCMLHPSAAGNANVDLRGMCHYGSMACKAFFCPAWEELHPSLREIIVSTVDDWHLYGLVITDVNFVRSIFDFIRQADSGPREPTLVLSGRASPIFRRILSWKAEWTHSGGSPIRRSSYYLKEKAPSKDQDESVQRILESLSFTFGFAMPPFGARAGIRAELEALVAACSHSG